MRILAVTWAVAALSLSYAAPSLAEVDVGDSQALGQSSAASPQAAEEPAPTSDVQPDAAASPDAERRDSAPPPADNASHDSELAPALPGGVDVQQPGHGARSDANASAPSPEETETAGRAPPAGHVPSEADNRPAPQTSDPSSDARPAPPHFFRDGKFQGQIRTFFMATQNDGDLKNWYSWASGGSLGYHTAEWHGLGLGATFYASVALLGTTDELDPTTGRPSRYELGLYNAEDLEDREVVLLGEAYVDYRRKGHSLWAGRHKLKTPLFNPQDGRMIPTLAQGVWYRNASLEGLSLEAGYLSHVAPRSADGYRKVRDSIGIYPTGRNPDGTPSGYRGNTQSIGLFIGSLAYAHPLFEVRGWNYFTENVFNALYADAQLKPHFAGLDWRFGVQYIVEHRVGDGGSPNPEERYFADARAQLFGGKIQAETKSKWSVSGAYNRITPEGRFLFPREWGREGLFVFQKRERSEGSGDLHAFLFELGKVWDFERRGKLRSVVGYGQYYRPDPSLAPLNKYALPSLRQVNLDTYYHFPGALEGLSAELLVDYKGSLDDPLGNPVFVLNKVDMINWNVVVNYDF